MKVTTKLVLSLILLIIINTIGGAYTFPPEGKTWQSEGVFLMYLFIIAFMVVLAFIIFLTIKFPNHHKPTDHD